MTETASSINNKSEESSQNVNVLQPDEKPAYRTVGQVKWFNIKSGFGFITVCKGFDSMDNKDIFVHYSSLDVDNTQYRYLIQGEYVEFDIMKPYNDNYEFHAVNVSGIRGGPLMCEIRKEKNDNRESYSHEESHRDRPHSNKYSNKQVGGKNESNNQVRGEKVESDDAGFNVVQRKRSRVNKAVRTN